MSNLGLGNRTDLIRHLLDASQASETRWNNVLDALGRGVAAHFDRYCNRTFERSTSAEDEFPADRETWVVKRAPIESITSVSFRDDIATGYVAQTVNDVIVNRNDAAGILHFGAVLGTKTTMVKIVYAGGYWFDTDESYGTSQPSGSTLVPYDLKLAWLTQCKALLDARGTGFLTESADKARAAAERLKLAPVVEETLRTYRRFV